VSGPPVAPSPRAAAARATPIPLCYWSLWSASLVIALVLFYGILTPVWMAIRGLAWASEHPLLRRGRRVRRPPRS
jgi:hypothetical protein